MIIGPTGIGRGQNEKFRLGGQINNTRRSSTYGRAFRILLNSWISGSAWNQWIERFGRGCEITATVALSFGGSLDLFAGFWQKTKEKIVVIDMDQKSHNPLEQIDTGEVLQSLEWNWLMLTPFPQPVVWFSLAAGGFILLIAWLQPSTHQRTMRLTGAGIIAVTLLFWLFVVALAVWLLRYVRRPGWARRR